MNDRIRFGQPIEPPVYQAELPFDLSTNSTYNTKRISENAPFQVYLLPSVSDAIWAHVNSSRKLECSGVLIGLPFRITDGSVTFVMVVGSIPHGTTRRSIGHVTVGPEEIAEARKTLELDYPGLIPVGWYHSHPGHGIFLSGQDMVIVRSIYNLSWHIALVVDPIHNTAGVFLGSEAERLPGWLELNDDEKVKWKEWVINQSIGEIISIPPPTASLEAEGMHPLNSKIIKDKDSPSIVMAIPGPIDDVENNLPLTEANLSQELAERDFQQARIFLESGDELAASRLIYTLQRKHPEFRSDEVKELSKQLDDLMKQSQNNTVDEEHSPAQTLPPHANPHSDTIPNE